MAIYVLWVALRLLSGRLTDCLYSRRGVSIYMSNNGKAEFGGAKLNSLEFVNSTVPHSLSTHSFGAA